VRIDERSESVGKKVRDAELARAPYMLVTGDRELEGEMVAVRSHEEGQLGSLKVDEFAQRVKYEISKQ
jgi:threonyl-tRNA synthetase